jgi:hypothetical protein
MAADGKPEMTRKERDKQGRLRLLSYTDCFLAILRGTWGNLGELSLDDCGGHETLHDRAQATREALPVDVKCGRKMHALSFGHETSFFTNGRQSCWKCFFSSKAAASILWPFNSHS